MYQIVLKWQFVCKKLVLNIESESHREENFECTRTDIPIIEMSLGNVYKIK